MRYQSEGHRQLCLLTAAPKSYSQSDIARRTRFGRGYVSNVVRGKRGASVDFVNAMAREFGIGQQLWSEPAREEAP
jgi:transcriptional regulator with XRE-family HTH domain